MIDKLGTLICLIFIIITISVFKDRIHKLENRIDKIELQSQVAMMLEKKETDELSRRLNEMRVQGRK